MRLTSRGERAVAWLFLVLILLVLAFAGRDLPTSDTGDLPSSQQQNR